MTRVQKALSELRRTVLVVILAQRIVDALVVFSLSFLATVVTAIAWFWAFIPTVLYLLIHMYSGVKEAKLVEVEAKVPEMEMQLRTVADNQNKENSVVKELQDEVLKRMRKVHTSTFVQFGRMGARVFSLILLSMATIFVSASNIQFIDLPKTIEHVRLAGQPQYDINGSLLNLDENDSEYIYGNKSVAELGYEELNLQISPVLSEIEIGQVEDPEKKQFVESQGKVGKAQKTGGSYEESEKVKENYKLVQKYFTRISGK